MPKRKRKCVNTSQKQITPQEVQRLENEFKEELRSIIRQWDKLHKPLRCFEKANHLPENHPQYRIEGAQSPEELNDLLLRFAGSVWQLKDRMKLWIAAKGLKLRKLTTNGVQIEISLEKEAENSLNLLLSADLYNAKKHGKLDYPKTAYSPILSGISFDTSKSGVIGIYYDGIASKTGDMLATNPTSVPWQVKILSSDGKVCFGDAVVVITRGFGFWIPIVRQLGILIDDRESKWIAENLSRIEEYIKQTEPFKSDEKVVNIGNIK